MAGIQPLLVIIDDLQWADRASIDLLFHLSRRLADQPILLIGAYRPGDLLAPRVNVRQERHPLAAVIHELRRYYGEIVLDLDAANEQGGRHFVDTLLNSEPNGLDAEFRMALYHHTEGQPLFTVELLRGLQASGALRQDEQGRWVAQPALNWQSLPTRVEATIAERMGRLDEALQEVLTIASVEGELFTVEVIAHVQNIDSRALLRRLSTELEHQQRFVRFLGIEEVNGQRLTRYRFHHFLFQSYLYSRLNASERAYLHEEVGGELENLYGERKSEIAVHLARHFQAAGHTERATAYLLEAGQRALRLSATAETIDHATNALGLLATLSASPARTKLELALQIALGSAYSAISGYAAPEVIRAYARRRTLPTGRRDAATGAGVAWSGRLLPCAR
jgi:predicted ATPase